MPNDSASGKELLSRAAIRGFMICITDDIDIPINILFIQLFLFIVQTNKFIVQIPKKIFLAISHFGF